MPDQKLFLCQYGAFQKVKSKTTSQRKRHRSKNLFRRWFRATTQTSGTDKTSVLVEHDPPPNDIWDDAVSRVRSHYADTSYIAQICKSLGYGIASERLRASMPQSKRARSGELGEILATEFLNEQLGPKVFVKRLRFKDGREMPLRGDDLIACSYSSADALHIIKGECKSRKSLTMRTLIEAEEKLHKNVGQPSVITGNFIAYQIKDQYPELSLALVRYLHNDRGATASLEHFIGLFTQNRPSRLFPQYLQRRTIRGIPRHLLAMVVQNHQATIERIYKLASSQIKETDVLANE